MMILAHLVLLALPGLADGPDPEALVARLSSPHEVVRQGAAAALERLGRPALPALYPVRNGRDPELARHASQLIDLIEQGRLLRATTVRLDFDDRPLSEVAEALKSRTGFPVVVSDDALKARRVTLREAEPVPFWAALDRLGPACGVRYVPGTKFTPAPREPFVRLGPAEGPPVPASDFGPFRVYLVRLSRHREVVPARPPARATTRETLSAELHFVAEPGLAVNQNGPIALDEAGDDRGRDLRPDPGDVPRPTRPYPPRFEEGYTGLFALTVPLKAGVEPGGRVRSLKGRIPITVVARTGDPLVLPLDGSEARTVARGLSLGVAGIGLAAEGMTIRLSIAGEKTERVISRPGTTAPPGEYRPPYRVEDHVQVQDDQGRPFWYNALPPRVVEGGAAEAQIRLYKGSGEMPARLLYHGVVGVATEVPFEFADLPLP